jgi:hypothetical protein
MFVKAGQSLGAAGDGMFLRKYHKMIRTPWDRQRGDASLTKPIPKTVIVRYQRL